MNTFTSLSGWGLTLLSVLLGWLTGSLLNYLADVLPETRSFSRPVCRSCGAKRSLLEVLFPQKCPQCQTPPTRRVWVVQILALIVVPLIRFLPPPALGFWISLAVFLYLAVVFIIDFEHRAILHEVSIIGLVLAIPFGLWLNGWKNMLIGAAVGFGVMLALYYFGVLFNRWLSRARGQEIEEVALGFGDVTLSGILGIALGSPRIIVCLFFAILLGGLISGLYILISMARKKYQAFTAIPYAPFLILAAVVLLYMADAPVGF